jgi:NTP pyrophosphatase (non-canonical NTP hydrolase)
MTELEKAGGRANAGPATMTLNEYQTAALRTAPRDPKAYPDWIWELPAGPTAARALLHLDQLIWTLGLAGEAGEVADYLKKVRGHGHSLDHGKMAKELGDVLWYLAVVADSFGFTLDDVARLNIEKLLARYPEGFTVAASINREGQ